MNKDLQIIILAAGKGTRMVSDKAKVLHKLAGKPLLGFVIEASLSLTTEVIVVVGHQASEVKKLNYPVKWVQQKEQLGTGHAVQMANPYLDGNKKCLILYGDVPLIKPTTIKKLADLSDKNTISLLTLIMKNQHGYGRIIRDESNNITSIVEEKDASDLQKQIKEINTGILSVTNDNLIKLLQNLKSDNSQGEYYLTDIIAQAHQNGLKTISVASHSVHEVAGVNDKKQLAVLERVYQQTCAKDLMVAGLTLSDYRRFDLRGTLKFGMNCIIDINVVFEGDNKIGDNVYIAPNCILKNVDIGDNVIIKANSILESCKVSNNATVGPFSRLRPGAELKNNAMVGNFVEVKKSIIGEDSKASHLAYIGDATIGKNVNVGAGVITCNYDGANKNKTIIEDDVFVGSDTQLVAPVKLGKGSTIGAGSTITTNVPKKMLVLSRIKQKEVPSWQRPKKKE
ncbi:MAG: UDP-N-acetylglucosamine diphosphorylase/glucosamine-1-phosphate N-acetyltransferase [Gammaproteobacteria bacterium]|nr:MAG: UDP-N-acetylglucosamine diphosphorylase/glucosamine-1-phosphate N-acetyltransferase [Gammaproteobacteria bacterium]